MIRIILSGCGGRMGRAVSELVSQSDDCVIVAGVDISAIPNTAYPVYKTLAEYSGDADVLVDFSHKSALDGILDYCLARRLPAVLSTTGYDDAQLAAIAACAEKIPLFRSANMSLGINLLAELVKKAASALGEDFDIEIVERHHNKKLDAPSGTALILADACCEAAGEQKQYVYDRHSVRRERSRSEIGIHSVRGGTIIGDHEVLFAGTNEVISISHSAQSRDVFASGAIRAARFMAHQTVSKLYTMGDVLNA